MPQRFFQHEIDEVLGLGSILGSGSSTTTNIKAAGSLPLLGRGHAQPDVEQHSDFVLVDRRRPHQPRRFQSGRSGDYGDWLSPACGAAVQYVQYAFYLHGLHRDVSATSPRGSTSTSSDTI